MLFGCVASADWPRDGRSYAEHRSVVSIAISAGAAIFVALIAALTANQRQRTQLAAGREQLEATLLAEQERQRRELEHDRGLHDLSEMRTILDDAASRLDHLERALSHGQMVMVSSAFNAAVHERPPHVDYDDYGSPWTEIYDALRSVYTRADALTALVPRLRIRVRPGEAVVTIFESIGTVAGRAPFAVDFVEEGATVDTVASRLAEIEREIRELRANWDGHAVQLAQFAVTAGSRSRTDSRT